MSLFSNSARAVFSALTLVMAGEASASSPTGMQTLYDGAFTRHATDAIGRCHVDGNRSATGWAEATAHLTVSQDATSSVVTVSMENGRPDTLFTIWLMLAGKDAAGESFGGSPIIKTGATALVPTTLLEEAIHIMKNPNSTASNGFTTDADGNGSVTVALDFPLIGGAYPFQRYEGFDPADPAFTRETPRAVPVPIPGKSAGAPFTLRLASHCGDNLHNGLVAGQHEPWFNWLAD
ncbi:MAG: hypothetical protein AAGI50_00120 [Pseudomonadota bacterium]